MAKKYLNAIIIDNHPLLVQNIRDILYDIGRSGDNLNFYIKVAKDCDEALSLLHRMEQNSKSIDLVLLEIGIPPSESGKYVSGEDIAVAIRERFKNARIIINTAFENNYRISTILKRVNPEGLIVRSDMSREVLIAAIQRVLEKDIFYSSGVLKFIRRRLDHDITLDELDIRILYELSQGSKMKDLPEMLPFSLATIEKRKHRLKVLFKVEEVHDRQLFDLARKYGFI